MLKKACLGMSSIKPQPPSSPLGAQGRRPSGASPLVPLVTAVRGSLFVAMGEVLRERRLTARHENLLDSAVRAEAAAVIAQERVPIALAFGYFAACDRLGLTRADQVSMGRALAKRLHIPIVLTGLRIAGALGMAPFTYAKLSERVWHRRNDGGAFRCDVRSETEGFIAILGYPLAQLTFVQCAWEGVIFETMALSGRLPSVTLAPSSCNATSLGYTVSWR